MAWESDSLIVLRAWESHVHGKGAQVLQIPGNQEVREMRDADTVLGIIRARGAAGLPLEDIYRQLFNPRLYLRAYDRIRQNDGSMTPGASTETVDSMSLCDRYSETRPDDREKSATS